MKKKQIILGSVMLGALTLGAIAPNIFKKSQKEMIGEDNALYGDRLEVDYNNPDVVFPKEAGEATVKAASVSIRYHDPAYDSDTSVYTDREFWMKLVLKPILMVSIILKHHSILPVIIPLSMERRASSSSLNIKKGPRKVVAMVGKTNL